VQECPKVGKKWGFRDKIAKIRSQILKERSFSSQWKFGVLVLAKKRQEIGVRNLVDSKHWVWQIVGRLRPIGDHTFDNL